MSTPHDLDVTANDHVEAYDLHPAEPLTEPSDSDVVWTPPPALPPAEARVQKERRFLPRSLANRLVLGVVALVIVVVTAAGAVTYALLSSFLDTRLDQQLTTTANSGLGRLFTTDRLVPPGFRPPQDVWAVALDTSGDVVGTLATGVKPIDLSTAQREKLSTRTTQSAMSLTTTDGDQLRVEVRPARGRGDGHGQRENVVAVIGLSRDDVTNTLHHLLIDELLIGCGAVLLAFGATSVGVRLSLRPLRRVTATARR